MTPLAPCPGLVYSARRQLYDHGLWLPVVSLVASAEKTAEETGADRQRDAEKGQAGSSPWTSQLNDQRGKPLFCLK